MKRNMELIIAILFSIEKGIEGDASSIVLPTQEFPEIEITHHVRLLHEGKLIHALKGYSASAGSAWVPHSLTWQGHEFLDAVRQDTIWNRVRKLAKQSGGRLPIDALFGLAMKELNTKLGLQPLG